MSEKGPQLDLPGISTEPLPKEGLGFDQKIKIHTDTIRNGTEIFVPAELDGDLNIPKALQMRHGGIIRISDADNGSSLVTAEIYQRTPIDVTDDRLMELLNQPFNGGKQIIIDGKEVIALTRSTVLATRDVLAHVMQRSIETAQTLRPAPASVRIENPLGTGDKSTEEE